MKQFFVEPIGTIDNKGEEGPVTIHLDKQYAPALEGLKDFSHVMILWWFSEFDTSKGRSLLTTDCPYKGGPKQLGIFATRSPMRKNPIAVSVADIISIDVEKGILTLSYLDAFDGTPVLDIKPYTPSLDRVEHPSVPSWCSSWPMSLEDSASFDWSNVFNF
ncbi:MAG: SAM-dependent methyltransferase [Lachnospiraceae bacterium]|nr:SAM-dependent methyltransferase [Lachnospiraceae bacterium]